MSEKTIVINSLWFGSFVGFGTSSVALGIAAYIGLHSILTMKQAMEERK